MTSNHHCLCATRMATSFCLCERPKVCFLCEQCTGSHHSKQAQHAAFPIHLLDIDHDLLCTRRQWCELLQYLKDEVSMQWELLSSTVDSLRADHCRRIFDDYERAKSQVWALCEGVNECITRAIQEMLDMDNLLRGTLSKECLALVQYTTHAEKRGSPLVCVHEEISRSVQGLGVSSVDTLAVQWSCRTLHCSVCSQQTVFTSRRKPPKSRKPKSQFDRYWICERCAYGMNPFDSDICQNCDDQESSTESLEAASNFSAVAEWVCPCIKQRNTGERCSHCHHTRLQQKEDTSRWTCECKFFNVCGEACAMCTRSRPR